MGFCDVLYSTPARVRGGIVLLCRWLAVALGIDRPSGEVGERGGGGRRSKPRPAAHAGNLPVDQSGIQPVIRPAARPVIPSE